MKSLALRVLYHYSTARGQVSMPDKMKSVRDINLIAARHYQVKPYDGRVTLFRATQEDDWRLPEDLGWREMASQGLEIHRFPGDHGQVLAEPNVSILAEKVTACLAQRDTPIELVL
jgi:thioesterase domain-containing protein